MKNMSQLDVQVCINPVTMEILTTGRSRRRRHRGGTREQELAEAARQRDERAERRAAQAEQEQQELSVVSQLDELVPDADSDNDDVIALLEASDVAALQTDESDGEEAVADNPQVSGRPTPNLKPKTQNLKPKTSNPKPET